MKIFNWKRGSGKTRTLITISYFTKARIITATHKSALYVQRMADVMCLKIPAPMDCITYLSIKGRGFCSPILIDELDSVLQIIFNNSDILVATRTEGEEEDR